MIRGVPVGALHRDCRGQFIGRQLGNKADWVLIALSTTLGINKCTVAVALTSTSACQQDKALAASTSRHLRPAFQSCTVNPVRACSNAPKFSSRTPPHGIWWGSA